MTRVDGLGPIAADGDLIDRLTERWLLPRSELEMAPGCRVESTEVVYED